MATDHFSSSQYSTNTDQASMIIPSEQAVDISDRGNADSTSLKRNTRSTQSPLSPAVEYWSLAPQAIITQVKDLARSGGPDLTDLRGFQDRTTMESKSSPLQSVTSTPTKRSRRTFSKSYSPAFAQHLVDHGIYFKSRVKDPENMQEITDRLTKRRPSLSRSRFPEADFKCFQAEAFGAKDEADVMGSVIPTIIGQGNMDDMGRSTLFNNLVPLTDANLPAMPDLYYGAPPEQLNRQTRAELAGYIIPSTREDKPMAPNFFCEVKGPDGQASVARRQACYAGALGARGIHMLRSYCLDGNSLHDNNAYTLSTTYLDGTLKIFAIYPTLSPAGTLNYHMAFVGAYAIIHSASAFRRGVRAYRNARDWAQEQRNAIIEAANKKADTEMSTDGDPSTSTH